MILKAKKNTTGDGPTKWEAKKGDLVDFDDERARHLLTTEPGTWEVSDVSQQGKARKRKGEN